MTQPFIQGLELSELFYREAVAPILARQRFPQLVTSATPRARSPRGRHGTDGRGGGQRFALDFPERTLGLPLLGSPLTFVAGLGR